MIEKFTNDIVLTILKILTTELKNYKFIITGSLAWYIHGININRPIHDIDIRFSPNVNLENIDVNNINNILKTNNIDLTIDICEPYKYIKYIKHNKYEYNKNYHLYNLNNYMFYIEDIYDNLNMKIMIYKEFVYTNNLLNNCKQQLINLTNNRNNEYDIKLHNIISLLNKYGDDFIISGCWAAYMHGSFTPDLLDSEISIITNNQNVINLIEHKNIESYILKKQLDLPITLYITRNDIENYDIFKLNNIEIKCVSKHYIINVINNQILFFNTKINKHKNDIELIQNYIKNGNL